MVYVPKKLRTKKVTKTQINADGTTTIWNEKGYAGKLATVKKPKICPSPPFARKSNLEPGKEKTPPAATATKKPATRQPKKYKDTLDSALIQNFFSRAKKSKKVHYGTLLHQISYLAEHDPWKFDGKVWDLVDQKIPHEEAKRGFQLWSRLEVVEKENIHEANSCGENYIWRVKVRNKQNGKTVKFNVVVFYDLPDTVALWHAATPKRLEKLYTRQEERELVGKVSEWENYL